MAAIEYISRVRLVIVAAVAGFWCAVVSLRMLWGIVRTGPKKIFGQKKREQRPEVLDDPDLGTHHIARMKNIRLHYVAKGQEGRPLVLFLHGFPEFWFSWRYQLKDLGKDYRAVAVDMRGYGESEKPQKIEDYHLDKLTDDIKNLVDHLGYKNCVLVGHDWGGFVAWSVATKYPDLVQKLVVCNIPNPHVFVKHLWSSVTQFLKSWYMFYFQIPYLPEIFLGAGDMAFLNFSSRKNGVKSSNITKDDIEAYKYTFQNSADRSGPLHYYRAVLRYKLPKVLSTNVRSPTLIIWGTGDNVLDQAMVPPSKKCVTSDCSTCYITGASHCVQQDEPDVVNKYIRDFLSGRKASKK